MNQEKTLMGMQLDIDVAIIEFVKAVYEAVDHEPLDGDETLAIGEAVLAALDNFNGNIAPDEDCA